MRITVAALVSLCLLAAAQAAAIGRDIRWQHPWNAELIELGALLTIFVDGSTYATVPVVEEDWDPATESFATTVVVPYARGVQVGISVPSGISPLSDALTYGHRCEDFDLDADGSVGGSDWSRFVTQFRAGEAFAHEVGLLARWYGVRCH